LSGSHSSPLLLSMLSQGINTVDIGISQAHAHSIEGFVRRERGKS
jgi:hypothetical protein